jgi:hypothetical protein
MKNSSEVVGASSASERRRGSRQSSATPSAASANATEERGLLHEIAGMRGRRGGRGILRGQEREARPPVGDLPTDVRQRTGAGDGDGGPHTPLAQHLARTHHEQAEREHSEQRDDGVIGLQADSGDEPEQRSQARLGSQEDPQCEVAERDPDEQIEHRGVKDRSDAQAVGSEHERERGEQLRRDAASKLACTQCDKHGRGHPRRNTGQAQRHERRTGEVDRDASDQRGDEREAAAPSFV